MVIIYIELILVALEVIIISSILLVTLGLRSHTYSILLLVFLISSVRWLSILRWLHHCMAVSLLSYILGI